MVLRGEIVIKYCRGESFFLIKFQQKNVTMALSVNDLTVL